MKYRNNVKVLLISLAVFLVFSVTGGICVGVGVGTAFSNSKLGEKIGEAYDYFKPYIENFSLGHFSVNGFSVDGTKVSDSDSLSIDGVGAIEISDFVCDIDIARTNGDKLLIHFRGVISGAEVTTTSSSDADDSIIGAESSSGVIRIDMNGANGSHVLNMISGKLKIEIPSTYTGKLVISGGLGTIDIESLTLSELSISDLLGTVEVDDCTIGFLDTDSITGTVEADGAISGFKLVDTLGTIKISSEAALKKDSVIQDCSGTVNIELPRDSKLNVTKSDILGVVSVKDIGSSSGSVDLTISDISGTVKVRGDD